MPQRSEFTPTISADKLTTSHQRVWMCGVCQQAPDAAALCVSCDTDIHSANPLARRHGRVPVEPFYDAAESIVVKSTTGPSSAAAALNYLVPNGDVVFNTKDIENNAALSWLIPNPNFNSKLHMDIAPDILKSSDDLIFPEMDSLLEFDYPTSVHTISGSGACNDSVVPVQPDPIPPPSFNMNYNVSGPADHNCFDLDFFRSKLYSSFNIGSDDLHMTSELRKSFSPLPLSLFPQTVICPARRLRPNLTPVQPPAT